MRYMDLPHHCLCFGVLWRVSESIVAVAGRILSESLSVEDAMILHIYSVDSIYNGLRNDYVEASILQLGNISAVPKVKALHPPDPWHPLATYWLPTAKWNAVCFL